MSQLEMFKMPSRSNEELKLSEELTEFQEEYIYHAYVDNLMIKKHYAEKIGDKWFYTQDRYKLLHYLLKFANGKKNSIRGYELANVMFNISSTEKLRNMINELRNDINVDIIIGSWAGGYFIAKHDEIYEAVKYIFGKSVNEMITSIRMFPALYLSFIKIAQVTYQHTDKASDKQITAQFDNDTKDIIDTIIRYADTLKKESKKWLNKNLINYM